MRGVHVLGDAQRKRVAKRKMGKSFKQTPVFKYAGYGRAGKKRANKRGGQTNEPLGRGKRYRKLYQTWYIHDVVTRWTRSEAEECGTLEEWEKPYHRK